MKTRSFALVFAFAAILLVTPVVDVYAVPSLGVATQFGYVGSTGQTGLESYQDYFVNTFITGTDATHGFLIGPSGSNLIVFTNITGANIYLLTTSDVNTANAPTLNSLAMVQFAGTGQFDGYAPTPYYGRNLGPVTVGPGAWSTLPSNPFTPGQFYALNVQLNYSGSIGPSQYFFAVADANGLTGLQASGGGGFGPDPFSPKTTSAVSEPGTLLLLGSGLVGLGLLRRRVKV